MYHFNSEFIRFFKGLKKNNNKEWFHENKKVYDQEVKEPFYAIVARLISLIQQEDDKVDLQVKDAVFRINKDIRFSKDKTPYKTHVAAVISEGGRKQMQIPGIYFHFSPDEVMIGGGAYMPDKDNLFKIRAAIASKPNEFKQILADKEFKKTYPNGIEGEENKVVPKPFKTYVDKIPLIKKKQFYFMAKYKNTDILLKPELIDFIMKHYHAGKEVNNFLAKAMGY